MAPFPIGLADTDWHRRLPSDRARLRPRVALAIATEERIGQAVADFFLGKAFRTSWRTAYSTVRVRNGGGAVNPRGLMANSKEAYDDLIEMGARVVAFSALTGRALPRRVHELISEAADLRGAWREFSGGGKPGAADLPIVDSVIDEVHMRANALECEIFGEVRYSDEAVDLSGLSAQMRSLLGSRE